MVKFSPPHRSTFLCSNVVRKLSDGKSMKSCVIFLTKKLRLHLKLSQLRGICAQNMPRPAFNITLTIFQISSKSVHFRPNYSRTRSLLCWNCSANKMMMMMMMMMMKSNTQNMQTYCFIRELSGIFDVNDKAALWLVWALALGKMRASYSQTYNQILSLPLPRIAGPQNCDAECCSTPSNPLMQHHLKGKFQLTKREFLVSLAAAALCQCVSNHLWSNCQLVQENRIYNRVVYLLEANQTTCDDVMIRIGSEIGNVASNIK